MRSFADRFRELALSFPESCEDAPWGFPAFKVGANKLFAWMIEERDALEVTLKLSADEREVALGADRPLRRPVRLDHRFGDGRGDAGGGARVVAGELLPQCS